MTAPVSQFVDKSKDSPKSVNPDSRSASLSAVVALQLLCVEAACTELLSPWQQLHECTRIPWNQEHHASRLLSGDLLSDIGKATLKRDCLLYSD